MIRLIEALFRLLAGDTTMPWMLFRSIAAIVPACIFAVIAYVHTNSRPLLSYGYVTVTYSCSATGHRVAVLSQTFGACDPETSHSQIAEHQRDAYDKVAAVSCAGKASVGEQSTSYEYEGPSAEARANRDRSKDAGEYLRSGYEVSNAYLQTPYFSKCR
jgi:hypothetical protein